MTIQDSIREGEPCILVRGPRWGDAEFLGQWLLAAAKAEMLWKKAVTDPKFKKQVEAVMIVYIPDFGMAATDFLRMRLKAYFPSFVVRVDSEEGELFVMMAQMGFFEFNGQHYRMVIPSHLTIAGVKTALLKFAQTEDDESRLHPEHLVATVPRAEAVAWQRRQRAMDEFQRDPAINPLESRSTLH